MALPPTLSSCAAAPALPAVLSVAEGIAYQLGIAIAANAISGWLTDGLPEAWEDWNENLQAMQQGLRSQGREYFSTSCQGDPVPPAIFFDSSVSKDHDPESDQLIVAVNGGSDRVTFEPWAWKALLLFIDELTKDKEGDTLAGFRSLCKISLIPSDVLSTSASTESGRSTLLAYKTRNGEVEMNRRTDENGTTIVQVTATGIPVESGSATSREFEIPKLGTPSS